MTKKVNLKAIANRDCREYGVRFDKGDIVTIKRISDDGVCYYIHSSDPRQVEIAMYTKYFDIIYDESQIIKDGEKIICSGCNEKIIKIKFIGLGGKEYCKNCYFEKYSHCSECGKLSENNIYLSYHDVYVCNDCLESRYTKCDDCNRYYQNDNIYTYTNKKVCFRCNDNYYQCEICKIAVRRNVALIRRNSSGWNHVYCSEECYENRSYGIQSHDYKPDPKFKQCDNECTKLFMGIELEVDKGGENNQKAGELSKILDRDFVYCKHDGSLKSGFEIVTQPATFQYHMSQREKYSEAFQYLIKEGYKSHVGGTCGLHVHVSKNYFGEDDEQEANIAKVLYVFEKYWGKFIILSRRTQKQLNQWAARYCFRADRDYKYNVNEAKSKGRYLAVNLRNDNTIEFRMFRGTLNIESFLATIQLISTICEKCKNTSIDQIQTMSFDDFVKTDYLELNNYIKRRWENKRELESIKRAKLVA